MSDVGLYSKVRKVLIMWFVGGHQSLIKTSLQTLSLVLQAKTLKMDLQLFSDKLEVNFRCKDASGRFSTNSFEWKCFSLSRNFTLYESVSDTNEDVSEAAAYWFILVTWRSHDSSVRSVSKCKCQHKQPIRPKVQHLASNTDMKKSALTGWRSSPPVSFRCVFNKSVFYVWAQTHHRGQ